MKEIVLNNKRNGMLVLLLTILAYIASVALAIWSGVRTDEVGDTIGGIALVVGLVWVTFGWIPFIGLHILKPQEALVLTLFGKYIGTIKGEGF